jgi:AcrR family transcriptional regulator
MADSRPTRGGGSTRDALLDAALAVFTEHTYGGTSVATVAERAGVAVGTIYRHFPSKEALGNAVFRRWKGRLLEYAADTVDPDAPVRTAFGQMWRALLAFARDHPKALAFIEHQQHDWYLDADSLALCDRVEAFGVGLVTRGQRAGLVRPGDPDLLVALVYGSFVGLTKARPGGIDPGDPQWVVVEEAAWGLLRRS